MRKGQKAAGLISTQKMAELPKDKPLVSSVFFAMESRRSVGSEMRGSLLLEKKKSIVLIQHREE